MKRFYLLIVLISFAGRVLAQSGSLEDLSQAALSQRLALSKNDTVRVQLQLALGWVLLTKAGSGNKEIDSATALVAQAAKLSLQINYNEGTINTMLLKAQCLQRKNNANAGLKTAQQALAFAQKVKSNIGTAECYVMIGQFYDFNDPEGLGTRRDFYKKAIAIFRQEGSMRRLAFVLKDDAELLFLARRKTEAIKVLFEALNINKAIGYKHIQAIYWLIGRTSNEFGDFPNALKYNLLAIKTAKEVGDSTLLLCSIYHNMAVTYVNMKDFKRAIPYSLKALHIAKAFNDNGYIGTVSLHLAIAYTRINKVAQALAVLKGIKLNDDNDQDRLIIMDNFLINLVYARQFNKAEKYVEEVKILSKRIPPDDYIRLAPAYNYLAEYYVETKQIKPAYFYTDLYAGIANKFHFAPGIRTTEKHYYELDSLQGNFKSAIKHYLVAQRIKDSIDNVTKAYQISLLQIENETEKKNNDIDALTKQALVKDSTLKRSQLIQKVTIAGGALLLIITALIYNSYRLKQRSNALLLKQKAEIDQQNIALQHLVNDKNQLIDDKDELLQEKDLLLKEVNHRVKNNLQIVMSLLQSQSGYLQNKQAQDAILEGQNRVQSIALIHDQLFRTEKVTEIDLVSYIAELVHSLDYSINKGSHKVKIKFNVDAIMLDVSQAIPVGIILNESVTNALKYAFPGKRTGEIVIMVKQFEQEIALCISDNGVGLPAGFCLSKTNSLGMTLIEGLANQLNGSFHVEGGNGVTISIKFPVELPGVPQDADTLAKRSA